MRPFAFAGRDLIEGMMRRFDSVVVALGAAVLACGSNNSQPPPVSMGGTGHLSGGGATGGGGTGDGTATDTGTGTTGATTGLVDMGVITDCGDIVCQGHGACVYDNQHQPYCKCDDGYLFDEISNSCVVDENCIQVRLLEDYCRQVINGEPAVAVFFSVDFCAGTAVLPEKLQELGLQLQVLENGVDVSNNVESYAVIIDKDVESYVTLALDVSDSVTTSEDLPALVTQLRSFAGALAPGVGEPPVYLSIYVFGRSVAEYVPFTRDFAAVDAALAALAKDPAPVVTLAGNGQGTDLFDAVETAIHRTQRIRDLRDAVTWGGVLTTGTIVVVTDGRDTSNGTLAQSLIDDTTNNIISVGIGAEFSAQDPDLQAIGRDGSFLAPTVDDWAQAFAEITERVDQYPERSYLLGYCSSATEGQAVVRVSVAGGESLHVTSKTCTFNANVFSSDPGAVCGPEFFSTECDGRSCGGLTGCGACSDDQCCDGSSCRAPGTADDQGVSCVDQDDLCGSAGQICDDENDNCVAPTAVDSSPCGPGCEPGVGYCVEDVCVPVLASGVACAGPQECPELNCQRINPDNALEPQICRPQALLHDGCGNDEAICEPGGYCSGGTCLPRQVNMAQCSGDEACRTAECTSFDELGNRCAGPASCFWSWNEKVPQ